MQNRNREFEPRENRNRDCWSPDTTPNLLGPHWQERWLDEVYSLRGPRTEIELEPQNLLKVRPCLILLGASPIFFECLLAQQCRFRNVRFFEKSHNRTTRMGQMHRLKQVNFPVCPNCRFDGFQHWITSGNRGVQTQTFKRECPLRVLQVLRVIILYERDSRQDFLARYLSR